jgi:biopolymer transport protein ExbD
VRLPRPEPKKARIEIIPMIDAIFFLLVFFMYSSLSMVKMNGLAATLPKAPPSPAAPPPQGGPSAAGGARTTRTPQRLMLDVPAAGALTVDGAAAGDPQAAARALSARLAARPDAVVVVRAGAGATTQRLVDVMDALNAVRLPDGKAPTVLVATPPAAPSGRDTVTVIPEGTPDAP